MLVNEIAQCTKVAELVDEIMGVEEAVDVTLELPLIADSMLKVSSIKLFKFVS